MKKYESKTAQLTLGAILVAVFVILHIIIPGGQKTVQGMLMILTFLPVTIYALCCGMKKALVMAAACCGLCALLLPPEVLLSFAIPAVLIGLAGGLFYGKRRRLSVILIFSVMQLVQNLIELAVYYLLSNVDFMGTYRLAVSLVYERIPEQWLTNALFSRFVEDLMVCSVPCLAILGAGAKGILSFLLLRLLYSRLVTVMGPQPDDKYTAQTKFAGKGISIAYFVAICICALVTAAPFLGLPYHFISAAAAAMGVLLAILYVYYFYTVRVRSLKEHKKRLIGSFLLMVTLPIGIFALPWLEMYLLKKETEQ